MGIFSWKPMFNEYILMKTNEQWVYSNENYLIINKSKWKIININTVK